MNEDNFFFLLFYSIYLFLSYLFNEQFSIQTKSLTKTTTTSAKKKTFKGCTNVDNTKQQNYGRQMQYARDVQQTKKIYIYSEW